MESMELRTGRPADPAVIRRICTRSTSVAHWLLREHWSTQPRLQAVIMPPTNALRVATASTTGFGGEAFLGTA
jgi:hypothetical protein